jgi:hypothetical protein
MQFLIYGPASTRTTKQIYDLLAGHSRSMRFLQYWQGVTEKCDAVVMVGWRDKQQSIAAAYSAIGVPVIVVDWGYIARVNLPSEREAGYWQVSPGGLNRPPQFDVEPDRLGLTGVDIATRRSGDTNGYVLVCGQIPTDAAVSGTDHKAWLLEQMANYPDAVYREHPRGGVKLPQFPQSAGTMAEALEGARLVVTYNSNAGHDALLAGVPVVCDPCAAYAELSGERLPSLERRRAYFSRIAYGQWRWDELGAGVLFVMENLERWHGVH